MRTSRGNPLLVLFLYVTVIIRSTLAVEKTLIESFLPVEVTVPESSFIDMLVALSVLPIATFTTITVLGGGAIVVPKWMQDPASKLVEMNPTKKEENVEQIQQFSSLQSTSAKRIIEDDGNEPRMEIIESTPTGGISGWVASQVADRLEARSKKKE